jgi:hypothetical protein
MGRWEHRYLGWDRFPGPSTPIEIEQLFTLESDELACAQARRTPLHRLAGDCQEFRARLSGLTDQSMAVVKRSPNRTANWDLAMAHSRGGMIHCFSERFKTRKRSLVAASSLGK